jgi:glycosyltransferase involved in cell wall biosynthesis
VRVKVLLFANTDWYLYNFRRSLARAIVEAKHEVVLVSPPGPYGQRLADLGLKWRPAPMERRSLNPLRELQLLLWLKRLIIEEKVDFVHGFTIKCAVYGSLAAKLAGVPNRVSAVAGMGYVFTNTDLRARVLRPVVKKLLQLAFKGSRVRLILQNPDDLNFFRREALVDPTNVRLIPGSGVDCDRFQPAPAGSAGTGEQFRVLLAARLLWDKGIAEYVAAARELRTRGRPIEFLLAGEPDPGNPAAVPVAQVEGWVKEGILKWLGHVDNMPGLLQTVDAAVLPSYREGLPKGLIEAAACGVPLITTDVPGCREVVTHGVSGLLVPARDAKALAGAIASLHDSLELRKSLGDAARKKALNEFDEKKVVAGTLDVYRELDPSF